MLTILLFTIELSQIPSGWCLFRTQTHTRSPLSPILNFTLLPFCVQNYEFYHVNLVYAPFLLLMFIASATVAGHVYWPCIVRGVFFKSAYCGWILSLSIGGRVCLIFPFCMFLMGWHGVIYFPFTVFVLWFLCGSVLKVLLIPSSWSPRSLESDFSFLSCWILPGSYVHVHVLFSSAVQ